MEMVLVHLEQTDVEISDNLYSLGFAMELGTPEDRLTLVRTLCANVREVDACMSAFTSFSI